MFTDAQVGSGDDAAVSGDQGPLDGILQLPDVAGPGVSDQELTSLVAEARLATPHPLAQTAQEIFGEDENVSGALPQRRERNAEYREPVVEVRAEGAGLDQMLQIPVRGGDQPDIGPKRRRAPDPLVLPFLKNAKQLRLDRGGEITDLIEEERAAGGQLEATAFETIRAGEGPALVSEELGLRQRFGQGGAVDRHEGTFGAAARIVDGASDQLLAGPALAGEQDRCVLRGDQGRLVQRLAKGFRTPYDAVEAVLFGERSAQAFDSAFEPAAVLFGGGQPLLLFGQALVLECDHQLGRDP